MGLFDIVKKGNILMHGGGESESQQRQQLYGPQAQFAKKSYFPYLTQLYNQYSQSPESLVAGFTPTQEAAQRYGAGYAGDLSNLTGYAGGLTGQLASQTPYERVSGAIGPSAGAGLLSSMQSPSGAYGSALNQMMSGDVNLAPYNQVADALTQRMAQNYQENVVPSIRRNSLSASGVPTSREGLLTSRAGGQFTRDLGSALSNLYLPAYQQAQEMQATGAGLYGDALNRRLAASQAGLTNLGQASQLGSANIGSALNFTPQLAQLGLTPYSLLSDIGSQQQAMNQARISAPFTFGTNIQSLLGSPIVLGSGSSTGYNVRGVTQGFSDIFGGGGGAIGGAMMSDRRLKRNLKKIGEYLSIPVYEFNYLWDDIKHIGVMAQDVLKVKPEAVLKIGKYYAVNYGEL